MTSDRGSDTPVFLRELAAAVLLAGAFLLVADSVAERLGWCKENGNHFAGTVLDIEAVQGGEVEGRAVVHAAMVGVGNPDKYVRGSGL